MPFKYNLKIWMRVNSLKVIDLKSSTLLDKKTITRLRANKNLDKMTLGTFLKLKEAYPDMNLSEVFPPFEKLCNHK